MKKVKNILRRYSKKIMVLFLVLGLFVSAIGISPILTVYAQDDNTRLVLQSNGNTISIDETDTNKLIYKIDEDIVGTAKVKIGDTELTPTVNNNKIEFQLPKYTGETYQVTVEVTSGSGYNRQPSYFYNGSSNYFPGDNIVNLDITQNNVHTMDFNFESSSGSNQGPQEPIVVYPIVAYFNGILTGVEMSSDGTIIMPSSFKSGNVTFKAKIYILPDNSVVPDDGMQTGGTSSEVNVAIEGIANGGQINNTVSGDRNSITIGEDFKNYGKATVHIVGATAGSDINTIVNIVTEDVVTIKAEAPISMSYSLGSAEVDNAIITSDSPKDLSVFFGNTETTLVVSGPNTRGIKKVVGGSNVVINDNGSATISLPNLSKETSTKLVVTIEMADGTEITRTIYIKRTALMLSYDDRTNELKAGYVINKSYLYNNQQHNDAIFNAYLQVIFYKGNAVAGYKQIKIDDEETVNNLQNNQSGSMELYSDNQIIIYEDVPDAITGASVFLTNGPISFESSTLPSIEYGIGAGLKITWEEN